MATGDFDLPGFVDKLRQYEQPVRLNSQNELSTTVPIPTSPPASACPNCGYCPHCGRSNGWQPYRPYWYSPWGVNGIPLKNSEVK